MEQRQTEAVSHFSRTPLLAACLCAISLMAIVSPTASGQGRGSGVNEPANGNEIPADVAQRNQEIQRVIERSNSFFQSAEINFKENNIERARREYDRALDIVLESGIDVRSDARLLSYYQNLVDQIFQRQMSLLSPNPASGTRLASNQGNNQDQQQNETQGEKAGPDRGFGQQVYTPSPLDDLTKLKLTDAETSGVTDEQAKSAVAAAGLDFTFKPNALIQSFINYYTGRGRATMESGLRRSGRFMAMARQIFKEEGVPQDIVWLGQVESLWSPVARSWAAAVGLWQFIPDTAARYGLQQNLYVDERSSFEKATRASARYLKWLATRYDGNWELAMAAYNSGEHRVDAAIARSGYADFWHIYERGLLPNETRNYVPNILAVIIIAKNPEKYGFSIPSDPPMTYDYVKVNNMVDLRLVADATDTPYDSILALNPELKRNVTPPGVEHLLRVPTGKGRDLYTALMRIPVEKRSTWRMLTAQNDDTFETISHRTGVSASTISHVNGGTIRPGAKVIIPVSGNVKSVVFSSARNANFGSEPIERTADVTRGAVKMISYKVKSGETIGVLAGRYNISVRELATLNRMSASSRLRAGQVIKVPIHSRR
ncbi:MAG: transglycosylase SLT domain-containing protein [Blastocatellia bacterium]|nr:transglycosylase SLT domain-containing protein [Blastocatellia bacterium]